MVIRSPFVSKDKALEEARKILERSGNNGISKQEFETLKNAGVISPRQPMKIDAEGPSKIITLSIPKDQCMKIPGAKVIGSGEIELCVVPIREKDGVVEIKELEVVE